MCTTVPGSGFAEQSGISQWLLRLAASWYIDAATELLNLPHSFRDNRESQTRKTSKPPALYRCPNELSYSLCPHAWIPETHAACKPAKRPSHPPHPLPYWRWPHCHPTNIFPSAHGRSEGIASFAFYVPLPSPTPGFELVSTGLPKRVRSAPCVRLLPLYPGLELAKLTQSKTEDALEIAAKPFRMSMSMLMSGGLWPWRPPIRHLEAPETAVSKTEALTTRTSAS